MAAGWFAMAVHALALLARSPDGYPSSYIAGSVNTHAVFLRRVLTRLVRGGLVIAREGREGGYRLARPAGSITLAEVYLAVGMDRLIAPSPAEPNPNCPVGSGMRTAFDEVVTGVEASVIELLGQRTVAEVSERAVACGRQK